jgi:hypothetical protein
MWIAIALREKAVRFEKDTGHDRHRTVTFARRPLLEEHKLFKTKPD